MTPDSAQYVSIKIFDTTKLSREDETFEILRWSVVPTNAGIHNRLFIKYLAYLDPRLRGEDRLYL
jgi:hypothetical protein